MEMSSVKLEGSWPILGLPSWNNWDISMTRHNYDWFQDQLITHHVNGFKPANTRHA
jgi:hypothetical protein